MMRARSVLSCALLLSAGLAAGRLSAQELMVVDPAATEQQAPQGSSRAADQSAPSWRSRFWNAIGGAVLGAGMGYFASQLASGDWEDGRISRTRREWAFAGGSVGLAAGFAFPFLGRGVPMAPHVSANPRMTITAREISESAATTAYEAVRLLRTSWLASSRPNLFADPTCGPRERVCEPVPVDVLKGLSRRPQAGRHRDPRGDQRADHRGDPVLHPGRSRGPVGCGARSGGDSRHDARVSDADRRPSERRRRSGS